MGNVSTREARQLLVDYIETSDNSDLLQYGKALASELQRQNCRFLWMINQIMTLGRMRHANVLDVGCGFGWHAVAVSLLGRSAVVANDVRPTMTETVAERVAYLQSRGAPVRVVTVTADICAWDFGSQRFDAIMCNEAIEHIHNLERFFDVCYRLLRSGGRLVVTNDNNILNRRLAQLTRKMWERRDSDWSYIEQLKAERPIENADACPYAAMRGEIVTRARPDITEHQLAGLVEATAGLTAREIVTALDSIDAGELTLPLEKPVSWCRNPVTGEYCERLLDPFAVAGMMRDAGFATRIRHAFRKFPGSVLNRSMGRLLSTALFNLKSDFVLVGVRQ